MLTNVPPTPPDAWVTFQDEAQFEGRPEIALLSENLGADYLGWAGFQGNLAIAVAPGALLKALGLLCDRLSYDHLSFMTVVHWPETPKEAFQLAYELFSRQNATWVRIKCFLPHSPNPHIATATTVYPAADWHECEAYDLFGVTFDGHPNLRRLLTPGMYDEFPLRRDFPLDGEALREFQKRLIGQWNTETDHDWKGSLDDKWVDRQNS